MASISVKGETQTPEVIKNLKALVHYRKKLERKYYHLKQDLQMYLREEFNDYIHSFNLYISKIENSKSHFQK
jgi:hypothetical protein